MAKAQRMSQSVCAPPPSWWRCVVAGLGVAVIAAFLMPMFPQEGAGYAPGYGSPVYAFEMARSVAELHAVFGVEGDVERGGRVAAMVRGTQWDFAFLVVYGLFIWSFFDSARRESGVWLWGMAGLLGPVAALADAAENTLLLRLLGDLESGAGLSLLAIPVWLKFFGLMAAGVAMGVYLIGLRHRVWTPLGLVAAAASLAVAVAFIEPSRYAHLMGSGITVAWLVQLAYAITGAVKARRASGAQSP